MYFVKNIYFVNEDHYKNFADNCNKFPETNVNVELRTSVYILSLPQLQEVAKRVLSADGVDLTNFFEEVILPVEYRTMVQLAGDLYFGRKSKLFAIGEGIEAWNDQLFRVFMQAVRMRKGVFGPKAN